MSRAWVFTQYGDASQQVFTEQPSPEPGPGQMLVDVRAAGVNPADWKIRSGLFGRSQSVPRPMGLELSGVISEIGAGVVGFAVGDEVLGPPASGFGSFTDETVVSADDVVHKPPELSFEEAATIPIAATAAYDASYQLALGAGSSVVVAGSGGGAGLVACQLCRLQNLRVLGIASSAKQELVESTGAEHIAYDTLPDIGAAVRDRAGGSVDAVIDFVGGDVLRQLMDLVDDPAHVILVADPDPDNEYGATPVKRTGGALQTVTELMGQSAVRAHIGQRFDLENADLALEAVEDGHVAGKVVVTVEG